MNKMKSSKVGENVFKTIINKGDVCYPTMRISLRVGILENINSIKAAIENNERIFIVHQLDEYDLNPNEKKISGYGVVASIELFRPVPFEETFLLVVKCEERKKITKFQAVDGIFLTTVEDMSPCETEYDEVLELMKIWAFADKYMKSRKGGYIFPHADKLKKQSSLDFVVDYIIANVVSETDTKLKLLEISNPAERFYGFRVYHLQKEAAKAIDKEMNSVALSLSNEDKKKIYLRYKLRAIHEELMRMESIPSDEENEQTDPTVDEDDYIQKINAAQMPDMIREKLLKEAKKLDRMSYTSAESNVIFSYLDVCLDIPWEKSTVDTIDLKKAKAILDREHYGLEKVKERIIEYLSVKRLSGGMNGQIICLVGAPGVGKTSIASAIAESMGKKFVRVSLGGVRDEADIRGHRKTYIGSMPGRIINAIIEVGVNNPLILLDEIDKMSSDFKGDPASALLEILDSEQNKGFRDHYVELPFDLSNCFFIATANTLSTVPRPLLDRMEVIELETYTEMEKLEIAKRHLVPKQLKKHGLNKNQVSFTTSAINKLIDSYTREAGVRNLEREIASVCRKCAKLIVEGETNKISITAKNVVELLDSQQIISEKISAEDLVGCVNGLAWTSVGGEIMKIEAASMKGNGKIELTGSLGAVMKESAMAALSYIRKNADEYGIDPTFHEKKDIHIHVPEGAVPKDGPSAGIALTTAIISELTGRKIKRNIAMTGEITLTGRVLPIGGLKEKTAAAYKAGVKTVILPLDNKNDIIKLDNFIKDKLEFRYVSNYKEIVPLAFAD